MYRTRIIICIEKEIQYNEAKYDGPTQYTQSYYTNNRTQADAMLTYDKTFIEKHTVNLLAGFHSELYKYKETKAYRKDFPSSGCNRPERRFGCRND